jgi:hypothetical protein
MSAKFDKDTIFELMQTLERNKNNISEVSRQCKISRDVIAKYKKLYWDEYLGQKHVLRFKKSEVEAKRLMVVENLNETMSIIRDTFVIVIKRAQELLNDEEQVRKMPVRDLVQLINVLSPYLAEKKAVIGTKEPDAHTTNYNQFVQNIVNKLELKK